MGKKIRNSLVSVVAILRQAGIDDAFKRLRTSAPVRFDRLEFTLENGDDDIRIRVPMEGRPSGDHFI